MRVATERVAGGAERGETETEAGAPSAPAQMKERIELMRKKLVGVLALALAFGVAAAGISSMASATVVRAGNLILNINGDALPRKLPARQYAPIKLKVNASLRTVDGGHVPAGRTAFFEFDRNGRVFTRGLPTCPKAQLENRTSDDALRVCRRALVGRGRAVAEIAFPDQAVFTQRGDLLLFNGPPKGRRPTIYAHFYLGDEPGDQVVTAVVADGIINPRYNRGRFGTSALFKVPRIAGGYGSIVRFAVVTQRFWRFRGRKVSYLYARCRDGRFLARGDVKFYDNTRIRGTVVRPCQKRPVRRHRRHRRR